MEYVELLVTISPGTGSRYQVSMKSPQGESPVQEFEPPTGLFARGAHAHAMRSISLDPSTSAGPDDEELGVTLFNALFYGDARSLLDKTDGFVSDKKDLGIRIRLSMDLQANGMAEIASLPWELMRAANDLPLVMSNKTVVVRSLNVLEPSNRVPYTPPLRILAIQSNPRGTQSLNLDEELDQIRTRWEALGLEVDFCRPVVSDLLDKLATTDPHVIHFMGHGDFNPDTGQGALLMEKEDGTPDYVDGEHLQLILRDESQLRLVMLNACNTGAATAHDSQDPFSSTAAALIKAGVPAVVAMQYAISDQAAITFADTFYHRITAGFPVDAAVAEARKPLWGGERSEWATPVLFMRSTDGVLFEYVPDVHDAPVSKTSTPDHRDSSDSNAFHVFLATPSERLKAKQRQIAASLAAKGINLVDAEPLPQDVEQHRSRVQSVIQSADLAVHLLGDQPGEPIDPDDLTRTYTMEQAHVSLQHARSQLVLLPAGLDIDNIGDKEYAAFLRALVDRPRDAARFELVRAELNDMQGEILSKCRRLEDARRTAVSANQSDRTVHAAFVDVHSNDVSHAADLISYLDSRKITPIMMPSSDNSPAQALTMFEQALANVPLFIVVFGSVKRDWVVSRLTAAVQFVNTHSVMTHIGVYLAPPVKAADQLRFPPFYDLAANMSSFDPRSVDALIDRATGAMA